MTGRGCITPAARSLEIDKPAVRSGLASFMSTANDVTQQTQVIKINVKAVMCSSGNVWP